MYYRKSYNQKEHAISKQPYQTKTRFPTKNRTNNFFEKKVGEYKKSTISKTSTIVEVSDDF